MCAKCTPESGASCSSRLLAVLIAQELDGERAGGARAYAWLAANEVISGRLEKGHPNIWSLRVTIEGLLDVSASCVSWESTHELVRRSDANPNSR